MSKKRRIEPISVLPIEIDEYLCSFLPGDDIYHMTITCIRFSKLLETSCVLKALYQQTYSNQLLIRSTFIKAYIKRRFNIDKNILQHRRIVKKFTPRREPQSWGDPTFRIHDDKILMFFDNTHSIQLLKNTARTFLTLDSFIKDLYVDSNKIICCEHDKITVADWQLNIIKKIPEENPSCINVDNEMIYIGGEYGDMKIRDLRTNNIVSNIALGDLDIDRIIIKPNHIYVTLYNQTIKMLERRMNTVIKTITGRSVFHSICSTDTHIFTSNSLSGLNSSQNIHNIKIWDLNLSAKKLIKVPQKTSLHCDSHKLIFYNQNTTDHFVELWRPDKKQVYTESTKINLNKKILNLHCQDERIVVGLNDHTVEVWDYA